MKLRILIAGQFINGRIDRFGWQRIVALAARIQFLQPQDREAINALRSCNRCASWQQLAGVPRHCLESNRRE